jgi:acetylornithine/N-succinyldiaminopimelate aminotransferase
METFEQIVEREKQYLLQTYARYPLVLASGKGVWVEDIEGRKYLDLVGGLGVNALGHAHKRIVKVIREQCARLIHVSNLYYNEYQGQLAERLCKLSGMERAFFCNSGTEAIEGAIKAARAAGHAVGGEKKCKLLAVEGSFHGRTFGALSLTAPEKYRKDFQPLLDNVQFIKMNDADDLYAKVDDDACAIVIEPIQGEGGIRECTKEFLEEARTVADRHKVALIFDEIQCGLGRTGSMFAYQDAGVTPDIVTIAKPLAAGLPLGAFMARGAFASAIGAGKHGTTFGGGPLACRVALEYLSVIEEEGLLENVRKVGAYLNHELNRTRIDFDVVREVRGRGMIQAIELSVPARPFVDAAIQKGLLINATQDVVIRLLPAFLLEEKHVDKAMKVLRKLLANRPVEIAAHSRAAV